ncbi:MAG: hypothetical protein QOF61_617, partial [Acidobacteriota bacterium]|nr:hypothetical protein [Acidobacteriota bacterium]
MPKLVTRALVVCLVALAPCLSARAQTPAPSANITAAATTRAAVDNNAEAASLDAVRRQLREQQEEIERLRATLAEQSKAISELLARTTQTAAPTGATNGARVREATYTVDGVAPTDALAAQGQGGAAAKNPQTEQTLEARVGALEA